MNNINKEVNMLPPFKKFCITIGELPTSYVESMTYYESLLWFTKYLHDTVIPAINDNAEAVIELQNKYIELKDYVDNYFESLDVQEEINNKLDDMAEKGELATLITLYLQMGSVLAFDTKSALKGAENVADGTICKTIGEISYNDGKGSFYKIRELEEGDVIDDDLLVELTNFPTLVAEKLPDYYTDKNTTDIATNTANITQNTSDIELLNCKDPYYEEITYSYGRANDTDYYIVNIPYQDSESEEIPFTLIAAQSNTSPLDNSHLQDSNFTCNASLAVNNGETMVNGHVIINGEIVNNNDVSAYCTNEKYLGIKADRTIAIYNNNTTAQTMVNDGVLYGCLIFGQCATGGIIDNNFSFQTGYDSDIYLGQKANKDILVIACDGRTNTDKGMNYTQMSQILINNGCINVYALDGGGSTSLNFKGSKLNMNVDDNGIKDRKISYLFNVNKKPTINKLTDTYNFIGEMRQLYNYQIRKLVNNCERKHYYSRYTCTNFVPANDNTNTRIPLTLSAPSNQSVIIPHTHTDGGTYFTFPCDGIIRVNCSLQIHSTKQSGENMYIGLFTGNTNTTNYISNVITSLENNTYLSCGFTSLYNYDEGEQISFFFDKATLGSVDKGIFNIEFIPLRDLFVI